MGLEPKEFPREWQQIDNFTERLQVPGGWLVRGKMGDGFSLIFLADDGYKWRLEEE